MNIIINQIRSFNRRRLTRRHLKKASVITPFGFKFFGPNTMQNGSFEATETKILIKLFSQANIFEMLVQILGTIFVWLEIWALDQLQLNQSL